MSVEQININTNQPSSFERGLNMEKEIDSVLLDKLIEQRKAERAGKHFGNEKLSRTFVYNVVFEYLKAKQEERKPSHVFKLFKEVVSRLASEEVNQKRISEEMEKLQITGDAEEVVEKKTEKISVKHLPGNRHLDDIFND